MALNLSSNNQQQRKAPNQNIQVYVRVRPLNSRERCIRSNEVIDVVSPREVVTRHSLDSKLTKKFTFDRTFGPESRQVDIYSTVVAPFIEEVLAGYNCTVFAYGQTGTGKTHTMVGNECAELKSSWEDDSEIGIIPRALSHLFDELRLMELEFSMRISYLELYNEELCDLLSSDDTTKIRIFDDSTKKGSVIIQGLEEIPVHSKDDVYKLLEKGKQRRKTATTLMNAQSSRSHTVFSILVHIRENGIDGEEMLKIGKLNLVDLAGSENVSKSGNEKGIRVRETVNINQSLLTLGRVITALVERTPHVPYRESKLTRLLQESLGGRTKTSIIATISPGHKDIEETLSTLEYAQRAKNIQNKPEVNQKLTKKTVLKEYTEEIDKLKRDLMAARDKNGIYLAEETYNEITLKMDSQNRELNEKMLLLKALKDELSNKEKIFNEVSLNLVEKAEELKRSKETLQQARGILQHTKKILNSTKRRYKEKKVLLDSHVKTEQELTDQATQLLQVADVATNDTKQLHSTIERRKDIDREIENACERFAARMQDNFELMDENFENFQKQHKLYSNLEMEEFVKSADVQSKLLSETTQKLNKVNDLYAQEWQNSNEINEMFTRTIRELSVEHGAALTECFKSITSQQQQMKIQIETNLNELQAYFVKLQTSLRDMRADTKKQLLRSTEMTAALADQMHKQIENVKSNTENNLRELAEQQTAIEKIRAMEAQEQADIEEFLAKMQARRQQRINVTDELNSSIVKIETIEQKSNTHLTDSTKCMDSYVLERQAHSKQVEEQQANSAKTAEEYVAACMENYTSAQSKLNEMFDENATRLDDWRANEQKHNDELDVATRDHEANTKRKHEECEQEFEAACLDIQRGIAADTQQLKAFVDECVQLNAIHDSQVSKYATHYREHMTACARDIERFKQCELQTYRPTGATPSKRDFRYPRLLAATTPHNIIVKRFRQENDWSDLDTTAPIDEEIPSDIEQSHSQPVGDLSTTTETILNSTPLEPAKTNTINDDCNNTKTLLMQSHNASLVSLNTANITIRKDLSMNEIDRKLKDTKEWEKENVSY